MNNGKKNQYITSLEQVLKIKAFYWKIQESVNAYKKRIASLGSMQDTGCLGLVHWDNPEGWYGEGGVRGFQDWVHVYSRGRFMLMYGKTNTIL